MDPAPSARATAGFDDGLRGVPLVALGFDGFDGFDGFGDFGDFGDFGGLPLDVAIAAEGTSGEGYEKCAAEEESVRRSTRCRVQPSKELEPT